MRRGIDARQGCSGLAYDVSWRLGNGRCASGVLDLDDTLTKGPHQVLVVRDDDQRGPASSRLNKEGNQVHPGVEILPEGRLVKHHNLGRRDQCGSNAEAAPLPTGQRQWVSRP